MLIQFYGPLRELAEKETDIEVNGPVQLIEIIRTLGIKYPKLEPYFDEEKGSGTLSSVIFLRQGKPLKHNEMLDEDDEIKVLAPISGG